VKNLTLGFIVFLMLLVVVIFVWKDSQVKSLQERLDSIKPPAPDTVLVKITIHDTVFVSKADTVYFDTTEVRGDTVFVYKYLEDTIDQPLFTLKTQVWSKSEVFKYSFKYKPITLSLLFSNYYDLRKGLKVTMSPPIGDVNIDWGNYKPLKGPPKYDMRLGVLYSEKLGPGAQFGVGYDKTALGVFAFQGTYGLYFSRSLYKF